jgi:GNAT superfamily N-acetyltransferase
MHGWRMTSLATATIDIVDGYWASDLGCSRAALRSQCTQVVQHAEAFSDYRGLFMLLIGGAPIVSLPRDLYPALHTVAARWSAADVLNVAALRDVLGERIDQIIGPAFIGYADRTTFRARVPNAARLLRASDAEHIAELRAACDAVEWAHGGSVLGQNPTAGVYSRERLVALAGYEVWGGCIAHIAVVTHPRYRGRGYAGAVVSKLTESVLARGLVPQYQTLESNTPSMHVAHKLGFVRYGVSMAVRLRRPAL